MAISAEFTFDAQQWEDVINSLQRKFGSVQQLGEDPTFMGIVSTVVFRDIIDHFRNEAGPEAPWQEWSSAYRKHMERIGKGGNLILQDTGRLRDSFIPQQMNKITSDGIVFYNNAVTSGGFPYAFAHNEGGEKLPKREFMWLSNNALSDIASQVARWLATFD